MVPQGQTHPLKKSFHRNPKHWATFPNHWTAASNITLQIILLFIQVTNWIAFLFQTYQDAAFPGTVRNLYNMPRSPDILYHYRAAGEGGTYSRKTIIIFMIIIVSSNTIFMLELTLWEKCSVRQELSCQISWLAAYKTELASGDTMGKALHYIYRAKDNESTDKMAANLLPAAAAHSPAAPILKYANIFSEINVCERLYSNT